MNKVSLVKVSPCSNTGSIRDDPYWTFWKNSLELIELYSMNKVSFVSVSSCSNTGSIRDDPCWTSWKNSVELKELSSIYKQKLVSLCVSDKYLLIKVLVLLQERNSQKLRQEKAKENEVFR